jgi:hypothetical protein
MNKEEESFLVAVCPYCFVLRPVETPLGCPECGTTEIILIYEKAAKDGRIKHLKARG